MKRTPLERKTPLKPGKPPARKKRVNPSNSARKRKMRKDPETGITHTYGAYHRFIKRQRCEVETRGNGNKCWRPDYQVRKGLWDGHHRKRVGSGGRDYGNELPLCRRHHRMIEQEGEAKFQRKTGVDPAAAAERWRIEWDKTHPVPRSSTGPGQS
jgi:hypothetical protein